ncbi:hypothetical protein MKX01_016358 [Papaver californicum]|nr:hypothetical protein MKX01_016358 [Papaver californicum]
MLSSQSHSLLTQNSKILRITTNSYSTKQNLQYPSSSLNFDLNLDSRRNRFRSKMSLNCTKISSFSNGIETVKLWIGIDEMDSFVHVGNKVADAAGEVIRSFFRKNFEIVDKEDLIKLSPVTIADRTAEEAMVKIILENFPSHAIYGEENGWRKALIWNSHCSCTQGKTGTQQAHICSVEMLKRHLHVKVPLYGCDCYAYALLASGFVDLAVESGLKPYDFLSLVPVIEGACGVVTDWKGEQLFWEASSDSLAPSFNILAAGDKQLH